MIGLFAALALFAQDAPAATPAPAVEAPKTDVQPKVAAKAKGDASLDKVVCRDEVVVGSHFRRKVCQSKRTEETNGAQDRDVFRHATEQGQIRPTDH